MIMRLRIFCLVTAFALPLWSPAEAQNSPLNRAAPSPLESTLQPETVAEQKAAVQARLDILGPPDEAQPEKEEVRAALLTLFSTLTATEEGFQRQAFSQAQLDALPTRLKELEAEQKKLSVRRPPDFPAITDELRNQYETQLTADRARLEELIQQNVTGEVRVAEIIRVLGQTDENRAQLEAALLTARRKDEADQAELLERQLQQLPIETAALRAEREWLVKRIPLQDALLQVAHLRLKHTRQDMNTIKAALGEAIENEQTTLAETATTITQQLEHTLDPIEALRLSVSLETIEVRRETTDYRRRLNGLGDLFQTQEQRNTRVKRNVDRLTSLVEKYASGEVIAQRLLSLFERLKLERDHYNNSAARGLQARVRTLNEALFTLDDQLYEFDTETATRLTQLQESRAEDAATALQPLFRAQKTALRDQQQVLGAFVQKLTDLLALHRSYERLLNEGYRSALTNVFWIRNADPLNLAVIAESLRGLATTAARFTAFARAEWAQLWGVQLPLLILIGIGVFIVVVLPWGAYRLRSRLKVDITSLLSDIQKPLGVTPACLIFIRSLIWPAYLIFLAWLGGQVLPENTEQAAFAAALMSGLQLSAGIVWVGLFGRGLLRHDGWGQHFWQLSPELCRFLRRTVLLGSLVALVLLVPRHILLTAPGEPAVAAGSLALARFCFLAFQLFVLVLVGVIGWRGSPLMKELLASNEARDGILSRVWPFLHLVLILGLSSILLLGIFGYRYAAQYLWFRVFGSLSMVFLIRMVGVLIVLRLLQKLVDYLFNKVGRARQHDPSLQATVVQDFHTLRLLVNGLLTVLAAGLILELWGIPASWVLTSPLTIQILTGAAIIALVIGLTIVVLQVSKTLTHSLLQTRTTRTGTTREASRQMRTLAPLVQTTINVGVIFLAGFVILEQIGFDTGPVLAGLGIFGFALGFASQSLIKDVINGLFMLFEDSLSVGDIVTLRETSGEVEKITLRAVTIRDLSGNVHLIPNSSIDMVTNMTKVFSRYMLEVGVAYREDVDTVIALLREITEEMRSDPEFGRFIIAPLDVLGLDRFEDSAVIIRARLITKPVKQWDVGREFNRRMKKVFDEQGIEIPFPHRTIYWGLPKEGQQPPLPLVVERTRPVSVTRDGAAPQDLSTSDTDTSQP